jgi:hypothetical protein
LRNTDAIRNGELDKEVADGSTSHTTVLGSHILDIKIGLNKNRTVIPFSAVNAHRCFRGTYCTHLHVEVKRTLLISASFMLVVCLAYSSLLKVERARSTETSVDIFHTTWFHIPGDSTLHRYHHESLKCNIFFTVFKNQ